ncbi:Uncharacterised protein [Klebsiella michiganensis]|nr:Uncharacterised protein [Klebsiella michiganensis]
MMQCLRTRFYSKNKTSSFFNLARIMIKELIKFKVRNIFLIVKVYVIGNIQDVEVNIINKVHQLIYIISRNVFCQP